MHTVDGRGTITSLPSLIIRPPTSTTGKYIGQVNLTAPAALGSKADLGIALPTNPLVEIVGAGVWEGVRLGSRRLEWILCVGRATPGHRWVENDDTAVAALDPKAGSGIHSQPNPLVESMDLE